MTTTLRHSSRLRVTEASPLIYVINSFPYLEGARFRQTKHSQLNYEIVNSKGRAPLQGSTKIERI